MSSIAVTGSASGTGVVSLLAPVTNTNQTLTLPDATGTVLSTASTTGISGSAISSGVVAEAYGGTGTSVGYNGFKNRIINGAMVIDQRNAGASVTPTNGQYTLDRWYTGVGQTSKLTIQQNAAAVTPPTGFTNYLGITSSSAYSVTSTDFFYVQQSVEGFNIADLGWGTASAQTVTLSFWVRSSLTGTFSGTLRNYAGNRSYPFTYTISAANTWEYETVTIAGDTSGTWSTNNSGGVDVGFSVGAGSSRSGTAGAWAGAAYYAATGAVSVVGTNGATFYITGVQLEKGSTATAFDYRPYELQLCQRYFTTSYEPGTAIGTVTTTGQIGRYTDAAGNYCSIQIFYPVRMRVAPTIVSYGVFSGATGGQVSGDSGNKTSSVTGAGSSTACFVATNNVSSGAGESLRCQFTASSEL
jgi:hypothetical protein